MTKYGLALVGLLCGGQALAGCFERFPGVSFEQAPPFGQVAWSPLMPAAEIRVWLEQEGFTEVVLAATDFDRFWVRGACLAQVSALLDSDQAWLVGSEFGQTLSDVLETRYVAS